MKPQLTPETRSIVTNEPPNPPQWNVGGVGAGNSSLCNPNPSPHRPGPNISSIA